MISVIFTAACAIPLCGLLIAWAKMGVNVNRMESSFLPFHIAIGSVFGLYFMYWFKVRTYSTVDSELFYSPLRRLRNARDTPIYLYKVKVTIS